MKTIYSIIFLLCTLVLHAQDEEYVSLPNRLKSNIFLKVDASATDCYVGEPIIVTYRLYSSLNSESNISKNPSFAGFEVRDLTSSDDRTASREVVDGVTFDVHTVRKVQLTPLKAGTLRLDPLVMQNRIKLVDASGNHDPILEGVKEGYSLNNGYYTLTIASVPITISVTGLPQSSKPSNFNGLVGNYKMNVQLPKNMYAPGETGQLTITIIGAGDFNNIKQPEIAWPKNIEVFPAKTSTSITDRKTGGGYKSFTIPFVVGKPGNYTIPSIHFSFFDATTYKYKTITNIPITFHVVQEGAANSTATNSSGSQEDNHYDMLWIGAGAIGLLLLLFLIIRNSRKKRYMPPPITEKKLTTSTTPALSPNDVDNLLRPAEDTMHHTGNTFYTFLKQALIKFFETRYALPAALFNKETLKKSLIDNQLPQSKQNEVLNLLTEIEMHIYSGGGLDGDKISLLNKAKQVLKQL